MPQLVSRTARIRRGWIDRVRGIERLYETKVTDGYHEVTGWGPTPSASEQAAQKSWERTFGQAIEVTACDFRSSAPSIALNASDSTNMGALRELIDALRADNARLLRWLIKRGIDGPEHEKLADILVRIRTSGRLQQNVDEERAA